MRLAVAALAFVGVVAIPSARAEEQPAWAKEPTSYRGLAWGAALSAASQALKGLECTCKWSDDYRPCDAAPVKDPSKVPAARECKSLQTIGAVQIKDLLLFRDDHLTGAQMSFKSAKYSAMRDILVAKYGAPMETRHDGKLDSEILTWTGSKTYIEMRQYGVDEEEGLTVIFTNEELAAIEKDRDARK